MSDDGGDETSSEGVTVRRYRPADRDAVWRVHDRSLRNSAMDYDPEYNRYLRHVEREFLDAGGEFLVVESPDGIVAIGGFQPLAYSSDPDTRVRAATPADATSTAHVRSVAVLPEFQSREVGRSLMTAVCERAAERGFTRAVLSTPESLADAHRFYETLGFEVLLDSTDAGDTVWYAREL